MATDSVSRSVTNTLSSTTADTVTITAQAAGQCVLVVVNHDDTNTIWFTWSEVGVAPAVAVAEADNTFPVLPGSSTSVRLPRSTLSTVVSVVGNGDKYTVGILPA